MSYSEYKQKPEDHRSCVVLVRPIGPFISSEKFSKLWDKINKVKFVPVTKDGRTLSARFVLDYPVENSEWGDFQYHRKVLGLICVAQYNEKVSGDDLEKQFTDLKNLYDSTLLDSRLVVLGVPRIATRMEKGENDYTESMNGSPRTGDSLVIEPNHYNNLTSRYSNGDDSADLPCDDELHQIMTEISGVTRRRMLGYSDSEEACSYLISDIEYMCKSMFFVLESKRLTATNVHLKQPSILTAPFEKPGVISMDLDTKAVKNRFVARCRKRIGDLCLLVDLPYDAVVQYQAALELLKAASDDFWIGCALEGIAVASSLVLSNQEKTTLAVSDGNMKRTSSFNGRSSPGLLLDPSLSLHNFNHLDLASTKCKLNVTSDDIIDQYREAISYYSKYPAAAIIEMEASLKATRLLIAHKKAKTAAEFLHHVAYVNLDDFAYKERVERYDVMGDLYHELKFDRKASFFKRVAAMHCVSPLLPSPAWGECYKLLLQAFPGFNMSFDPKDYQRPGGRTGWPGIRSRVFNELIVAARQLADSTIIVRHVSLCLHTMFGWMHEKEIADLVQLLETCTKLEVDKGLPLATINGAVLPPVPFCSFPLLSYFEVLKLPPQLEPHKHKQEVPNNSVFIYSPMNFTRQESRSDSVAEYEFCWVQGSAGIVEVHLNNPLPLTLKITDFSLIVEGVKFQSSPSGHTLPALSGPHTITIVGTPRSHGTLKIIGYQMTLFGVVSRCLFSELAHIKQNEFTVDVAPVLPSLQASSDLQKSPKMVTGCESQILTSAILQIYIGEQQECCIKLKNTGHVTITKMDITMESEKYRDILGEILVLDLTKIEESLPLPKDAEAVLTIRTMGAMKLTDLPKATLMSPSHDSESRHRASSALIESLLKITYTGVEGDLLHYYRETYMAIDAVLIPSINIISQDIQTVDAETCHIAYNILNESNMVLDIKSLDDTVSLKPMQSGWVHYSVGKCDSSASLEDCRRNISEHTHMKWSSEVKQKIGLVPVDRLQWDETELDKLRKRPFSVHGFVTKNSCSRYLVGEPIQLSYKISNTSGLDYENVSFQIMIQQDISSSKVKVHAGTSFVYIGQSTHSISKFDSGGSMKIEHCVALLYSGQFDIECQCFTNGKPVHNVDPGISILVV